MVSQMFLICSCSVIFDSLGTVSVDIPWRLQLSNRMSINQSAMMQYFLEHQIHNIYDHLIGRAIGQAECTISTM